jgi:hypothetical protein
MVKRRTERVERAQVTIILDADVVATIDRMADEESRSRSRQANVLLREAIEARGPIRRPANRKREAA